MSTTLTDVESVIKTSTNADNVEIFHRETGDSVLVFGFTVEVSRSDIINKGLTVGVINNIKEKLLNSNYVQAEINKLHIQNAILHQDLEKLNLEMQELRRYKTFYDLYKELNV
jgi:hypothetical protein